jgi:CRP-like cAMP-binding protein
MTPEALLRYDLPLFRGLLPSDLGSAELGVVERGFDAWELLFNQEDTSKDVYFLLSGTLLALYWTPDGREIVFTRFPVGECFGELAALDGGERSLAVVARSPVKVLVMPAGVFLRLFHEVRPLRERVTAGLVRRVRLLTERNLELTTLSVEQRVASYLIRLAVDRGCLTVGGVIEAAPTHSEIAASIGANREMVSRTMTRLSRQNAIRSARQRVEIVDPDRLSAIL